MAYDLFFHASTDPTFDAFRRFFRSRRHYEVRRRDRQAVYHNEETGVYFLFDYLASPYGEHEDSEPWASFTLNYGRPRFFSYEAAIELDAFVRAFGDAIEDPQDGMQRWSREDFLAGWWRRHCRAIQAVRPSPDTYPRLPGDLLDAMWRWNHHRDDLMEHYGGDVFAPRITLLVQPGGPVGHCLWPDRLPIALPRKGVKLVSLAVDGHPGPLVDFDLLRSALGSCFKPGDEGFEPHDLLDPAECPPEARRWLDSLVRDGLPPGMEKWLADRRSEGLLRKPFPFDRVLDREAEAAPVGA